LIELLVKMSEKLWEPMKFFHCFCMFYYRYKKQRERERERERERKKERERKREREKENNKQTNKQKQQASIPNLYHRICYMRNFLPESQRMGELGYCLVTLEAAFAHVVAHET